jgi:hypothetical protein
MNNENDEILVYKVGPMYFGLNFQIQLWNLAMSSGILGQSKYFHKINVFIYPYTRGWICVTMDQQTY